jgi:hypothetical protein
MEKWVLTIAMFAIMLPMAAGFMPEDRLVDWSRAGVEGGIPVRTLIRDCVIMDGAHSDGQDTTREIQACIDNAAQEGVAYLPAGTYTLSSGIKLRSHKTLRGAGASSILQKQRLT